MQAIGAGSSHVQNFPPREAPARPIRGLQQEIDTGLPAILLDSKKHRRYLKRVGVSSFSMPAPKTLSMPLWAAGGDALSAVS
jgi:hypothetical protein